MFTPSLTAALALLLTAPTGEAAPQTPGGPAHAPAPALAASTAAPSADEVIFTRLAMPDGAAPSVEVGVWAPREAASGPRPLVVISHGNGGDFRSHHDTAEALARAGFVVAALTHTGDNWRDQSRATDVVGRTRQLSLLIDYMVGEWEGRAGVDAARVGAFGFSAGGFTVLATAGGRPDLARLADHCRDNPAFYDCRLIGAHKTALDGPAPAAPHSPRKARIAALAVAAPALGFTFAGQGLADLTQPVQLWQAGDDQILPAPFYAEAVRDALPQAPEYHRIEGAGHFDFLPPCAPQLAAAAPMICAPTPGFDRAAFHAAFNRDIVRFFKARL